MTEKSHGRRAVVIGGSIAGLFVGAFLRRIGWQVDIYERSSIELIGRGVGIFATHLELLEALDKCGAGTVDIGVIVYKRITLDRGGDVLAEKPQLQIVTSWDRLRQVLLKSIDRQRYHFGHVFERVEQDGSGVHVYFANGRSERAALLVGCDGFRSSVRAHLAPEVQPIYSGYYIWRGAPNESDLSSDTRRTMFPYYSFFLGDQLQALGYPISGADDELRAGYRRYNWGWYRVADADKLKQMCVDDQGREHEFGVPPPLVRKDLVEQMRGEAEALLPPQYLDCLRHIDQPFFTPVYDFCSPSLVFGRVALVGDAASTPRPHIGFGVSKAGAEAQALAEALSNYDDIDRALAAYDAVRQPLSRRIVSHGRKLGTQLGVGIETDEDRRLSKLLQTPKGIMDWIAVPNFLEMRV
ncbi:MAG TPA: FAD-dependent monooxygenase [Xanthobacteraceae bacterium]|jgi:2-polyprenyl-6-methoxyphenol hydroxylase-like FAD-dependent oxidoreductase